MKMKDYSNYHNANSNSKITSDGQLIFEHSLSGYEGKDVLIDGVSKRVIIQEKFSSEDNSTKYIFGKIADIDRGRIINFDSNNYLVKIIPEDNGIYRKATIQLCNQTLTLSGTVTKTLVGYDQYGKPIYSETEGTPTIVPCVVEKSVYIEGQNTAINLSDHRIKVTMKYQVHDDLLEDAEFKMFDETYKIVGLDKTQVLNGVGLLIFHGERVVE
jgi:hypothetical protein